MSAVGGEGVAIEHACEAVNWSGCDEVDGASHKASRCRRVIVDDESPKEGRP
jgi:hypothetical protein